MTAVPSTIWRMLATQSAGKELPKGLDAVWDRAAGVTKRISHRTAAFLRRAEKVLTWEKRFAEMTDDQLKAESEDLRGIFRRARETPATVERAFALVREVAARQIGEKHFPVQIAGALALEANSVVEMATGEGKTLTATMLATVAGWRGRGCHVITTNGYLARRDAEWMGRIYNFCGLSVAHVEQGMAPPDRRAAYQADITYTTNKEVTADFLRDQLALQRRRGLTRALLTKIAEGTGTGTDRLVMRGLECAIVDEADDILVDQAVTPLIISGQGPNPEQVEAFRQAADIASQLEPRRHFRVNQRYREVELTNAGKNRIAELTEDLGGLWTGSRRREELVTQALTAAEFYLLDKQYVIQEGKVVIVDEFTGRLMPDREWRDGLHQAVEAKERVEVNPPKDTHARISFQRFFRLYRRLAGMTGTAVEARREFWQIYHRPVVVIPTNRPCVREHLPDRVYATESAKWAAVGEEIAELHRKGRPVLVGTRSVRASERLSAALANKGLDHQVLNAVRHAEEAEVVAQAGQEGKITVATNMAGRGTDIKLGPGVADIGGLHVMATERHEAGRIDRQLFGRSARQGDPGSAQAFVSLEDELVRRHAPNLSAPLRRRYKGTDREISNVSTRGVLEVAQRRAERLALTQRKGVLRTDDWLDEYLGFAGRER